MSAKPLLQNVGIVHEADNLLVNLENSHKGLLRNLDGTNRLHALLSLFLLFQKLALTRDIAAVALGEHVFSARLHRRAGDDLVTDSALDGNFEQLPGDDLLQLIAQAAR